MRDVEPSCQRIHPERKTDTLSWVDMGFRGGMFYTWAPIREAICTTCQMVETGGTDKQHFAWDISRVSRDGEYGGDAAEF